MTEELKRRLEEMERLATDDLPVGGCETFYSEKVVRLISLIRRAVEQRDVWAENEQADVSVFADAELLKLLDGGGS